MRTFIAIEFPTEINQQLDESSEALRRFLQEQDAPACLRWSPLSKAHLTLCFLGETSKTQAAELATDLNAVAMAHSPFTLSFGGIGCFPNASRPRVLWLGVGGDLPKLHALQCAVDGVAQGCGFEVEKRAYSPHVTLARLRRGASKAQQRRLGQLVKNYATSQTESSSIARRPAFTVPSISHIQSQLRPEGAIYTTLCEFELVMTAQA